MCAYGVETTVKSLSSHPVCQEVCKRNNGASCPPVSAACGDRAKNYSHAMTTWPVNTNYCATGEPKTRPGFPAQNESVTWECVGLSNSVPCTATRDAKPEPKKVCEGEIPVNSKPASDDEQEGLTANTQRTLVDSNTASVKCELVCISGYKLNAAKTACEIKVEGACGSAHNSTTSTKPTTNLCAVGTVNSSVNGT